MGFKLRLLQKEEMELWRVGVVLGRAEGKEGRGAGKDSWLSCSFLLQRPLGDTGALRWVVSRSNCWQGPSSRGTQAAEVSVLFLEMTPGVQERSTSFLSAFRSGGGTGLSQTLRRQCQVSAQRPSTELGCPGSSPAASLQSHVLGFGPQLSPMSTFSFTVTQTLPLPETQDTVCRDAPWCCPSHSALGLTCYHQLCSECIFSIHHCRLQALTPTCCQCTYNAHHWPGDPGHLPNILVIVMCSLSDQKEKLPKSSVGRREAPDRGLCECNRVRNFSRLTMLPRFGQRLQTSIIR